MKPVREAKARSRAVVPLKKKNNRIEIFSDYVREEFSWFPRKTFENESVHVFVYCNLLHSNKLTFIKQNLLVFLLIRIEGSNFYENSIVFPSILGHFKLSLMSKIT
jgi:hypothetical protein